MEKKGLGKIIAILLLVFGIGLTAGLFIGMPMGEKKGRSEAEQEVLSVVNPTEVVLPTTSIVLETTSNIEITNAPEMTQSVTPTVGDVPTAVPEVTPEVIPTKGAEPTEAPSVTPTEKGTPTVAPTKEAEPTAIPTKAVTPMITPKPTVVPTKVPAVEDIPIAEGEDGYFGRLHVEGTYLADKDDKLVQLRGISTHGLGWFPQYVNEAAIRQFNEEWGCNVFRLAMYTAEGAGYCTNGDAQKEKLKNLVHTGVEAAIKQDMYVIIDWHVLQDRDPNLYKDEAKKFFAEMSKAYGDDPHVIYEICNEPNSGVTWSQIKKYALEVIPVIRENAPNAIIIVGTPTWSQDVDIAAKDPITEYDNIMYAIHFYAETHRESLRSKCRTAISKGLPLFVTEYGICDASGNGTINETQANLWIEFLDSYGISHVAWNLSNKNESSSMIAAGCSKTNGFTENDLSKGGKWFVDMLKKAGVGIGSALSGTTEAGQEDESSKGSSGNDGGGTQGIVDTAFVEKMLEAGEGVAYTVSNSWESEDGIGVQLSLTVRNETDNALSTWERKLTIKKGTAEVTQNWNSTVSLKGKEIVVQPVEYNKSIPAGGSVGDIGIILNIVQ